MSSSTIEEQNNEAICQISSRRHNTRSSLASANQQPSSITLKTNKLKKLPDVEDIIPSHKRKRDTTSRTPIKKLSQTAEDTSETKITGDKKVKLERKERKPVRKLKNEVTESGEVHAPTDWEKIYSLVKEMRTTGISRDAAVDTMGCERIAEAGASPRDKRYHILTALMLSSQTKDTVNAAAMNRLYNELPAHKEGEPAGLTIENTMAVNPNFLNELIWGVGFHNNKTKYMKKVAKILHDEWNSDIPDTFEGLVSLPGVGPKMAYLCLSSAWGRTEGIGVDVHVHRITNLWGWHKTKTPEETRVSLESWLPKDLWHEINWLLVGFGQMTCLPVGKKCGECELGLQALCKSADKSKVSQGRKTRNLEIEQSKEKKNFSPYIHEFSSRNDKLDLSNSSLQIVHTDITPSLINSGRELQPVNVKLQNETPSNIKMKEERNL